MKKSLLALSLLFITGNIFAQADSNESQTNPTTGSTGKVTASPNLEMKLFPNPARNKITLQVQGFEPGMATVKIIDLKGKLLRQDVRLLTNGSDEIPMFIALGPCTCYVMVEQKGKIVKKKLIVY
jgi:hypothetical protein